MGSASSIFQSQDIALLKHIRFIDFDDFVQLGSFPHYPTHAQLCQSVSVFTPQLHQEAVVIFLSHVWLHHPYDTSIHGVDIVQSYKYDLCVEGIRSMLQMHAVGMKKCFLWMDCSCLNQQEVIPEERQVLDKIIQLSDCIFTPLYEIHPLLSRPQEQVVSSLQDVYPSPAWTGTATSYLNRAWCRLEMLCNLLIPVEVNAHEEERWSKFRGGLAQHVKQGRRPHFLYGSYHAVNHLPPEILPPLQCSWLDMLHPMKGQLTFAADRELLASYSKALQPLVEDAIEQEDCYEGGWKEGQREGSGKLVYKCGDIYEGGFHNDVRHGLGKQQFLSGDWYDGDWTDDQMNGFGTLAKEDGTVYEGDFFEDQCLGFVHVRYVDGNVYEGEMKAFQRHGTGKMTFAGTHGDWYDGAWRFDQKHGPGTTCINGKVEAGLWRQDIYVEVKSATSLAQDMLQYDGERNTAGLCHGKGSCAFTDGTKYDGDWREGLPHGQGTFAYADGSVYIGAVEAGRKHGLGKCRYGDGKVYEGRWCQDFHHGQGKLHNASTGEDYEGDFHYDAVHGLGHCQSSEGSSQYRGMWRFDMRHGVGKLQCANRDAYEGEWRYDQRHGLGTMANPAGIVRGRWKDGVLLVEESQPVIVLS